MLSEQTKLTILKVMLSTNSTNSIMAPLGIPSRCLFTLTFPRWFTKLFGILRYKHYNQSPEMRPKTREYETTIANHSHYCWMGSEGLSLHWKSGRSRRSQMFYKITVLKIFANFTGKHLLQRKCFLWVLCNDYFRVTTSQKSSRNNRKFSLCM